MTMTPEQVAAGRTLIEKLEAADGPSRELDVEIDWTAQGLEGRPVPDSHYGLGDGFWRDNIGLIHEAPPYTASIDAALSLVPKGFRLILDKRPGAECRRDGWRCDVWVAPRVGYGSATANARTPALALCIAALRAREQ